MFGLRMTVIGYDYIWLKFTSTTPGKALFGLRVLALPKVFKASVNYNRLACHIG